MDTIGLVGVGSIGAGFAERLGATARDVVAYDANPERTAVATEYGATDATSPIEVAERADAVVLALPGSVEVEETVLDASFLDALDGGAIVDATTTHPDTGIECARRCRDAGAAYVEAPLTGGSPRGDALMMIGASEDDYDRVTPLLDDLSDDHRRIGPVGDGRRFKLALQLRYALRSAIDAEVVAFCRELGVDPALFDEFLGFDVSDRYLTDDYETDAPGMGGLRIWHKDLGYALEVAREEDVPLPLTSAGHELYKAGRRAAGSREKSAEAVMYYWRRLCVDR